MRSLQLGTSVDRTRRRTRSKRPQLHPLLSRPPHLLPSPTPPPPPILPQPAPSHSHVKGARSLNILQDTPLTPRRVFLPPAPSQADQPSRARSRRRVGRTLLLGNCLFSLNARWHSDYRLREELPNRGRRSGFWRRSRCASEATRIGEPTRSILLASCS